MGCDIHSYAERKDESGKYVDLDFSPFGTFGFLADVRNYSAVPPISQPRGLPDDVSSEVPERDETWGSDGHSHSWLSVAELVSFDYDSAMEDRRHTVQTGPRSWNGGATCEVGQGKKKPPSASSLAMDFSLTSRNYRTWAPSASCSGSRAEPHLTPERPAPCLSGTNQNLLFYARLSAMTQKTECSLTRLSMVSITGDR